MLSFYPFSFKNNFLPGVRRNAKQLFNSKTKSNGTQSELQRGNRKVQLLFSEGKSMAWVGTNCK
jgi:hypothetical protein